MSQQPAAYHVTVTGIRDHTGRIEKPKVWHFGQLVWSTTGIPGALAEIGRVFFEAYPSYSIALPRKGKSPLVLTSKNVGQMPSFLRGQPDDKKIVLEDGPYTLRVTKLKAMSGDTPSSPYPSDPVEYDKMIQRNFRHFDPYFESIVQMPSLVKSNAKKT